VTKSGIIVEAADVVGSNGKNKQENRAIEKSIVRNWGACFRNKSWINVEDSQATEEDSQDGTSQTEPIAPHRDLPKHFSPPRS
jgi:hypothetical protein